MIYSKNLLLIIRIRIQISKNMLRIFEAQSRGKVKNTDPRRKIPPCLQKKTSITFSSKNSLSKTIFYAEVKNRLFGVTLKSLKLWKVFIFTSFLSLLNERLYFSMRDHLPAMIFKNNHCRYLLPRWVNHFLKKCSRFRFKQQDFYKISAKTIEFLVRVYEISQQ